ncbi:hypothetical protein EniLVp02_0266 [Vibrio phage EniLVp02]
MCVTSFRMNAPTRITVVKSARMLNVIRPGV